MKTFKKHHTEHLDGTRGSWRPALVASLFGIDGHPVAWKEIVVVSCHGEKCGLQYGVGGDDDGPQIQADGTTDRPVTCHHCQSSDHMTFEKHAAAEGRGHFNKLKAQAQQDVKDARIRLLKEKIRADILKTIDDEALDMANKILPDNAQNVQELFKNAMNSK